MKLSIRIFSLSLVPILALCFAPQAAFCRDVLYDTNSGEIEVYVRPGEPTQLTFPGKVGGGYKRRDSTISLDRKGRDLIVFGHQNISDAGEGILIRLEDGRSYSVRAKRASDQNPKDDFVVIQDNRGSILLSDDEEEPAYKEKFYPYASPNQVSGFMREMMLAMEFGKSSIPGYQRSDKYRGEVVLDDGTMRATIDTIFIGGKYWGYAVDVQNLLDQTQQINPATFRLDGTRAISSNRWELAPKPLTSEHQIAAKDRSKIYIVTKARE